MIRYRFSSAVCLYFYILFPNLLLTKNFISPCYIIIIFKVNLHKQYRRLTHFDIDTFVEEVFVKDGEWLPGTPEPLRGSYIFVCAHGTRDRRCGICGPAVITRFKDEIETHGFQSKVFVRPCSHIGGHKYAGNVIIFGATIDGEVTGHW